MTEISALRDAIESLLALPSPPPQRVEQLAKAYAHACSEPVKRLRRCIDYLDEGMITEAIHLVGVTPDLFQTAGWLQLSNPRAWESLCAMQGMAISATIDRRLLDRLRAAVMFDPTLDGLLVRHRLLALTRAPLNQRMKVLWRLREKDPHNLTWIEQSRVIETLRLDQIRKAILDPSAVQDQRGLQALEDELGSGRWTVLSAQALIDALRERRKASARSAGLSELPQGQLAEAYGSRSYRQVAEALAKWQKVVHTHALVLEDAELEFTRKVTAWLVDESRRRASELRRIASGVGEISPAAPEPKKAPLLGRLFKRKDAS